MFEAGSLEPDFLLFALSQSTRAVRKNVAAHQQAFPLEPQYRAQREFGGRDYDCNTNIVGTLSSGAIGSHSPEPFAALSLLIASHFASLLECTTTVYPRAKTELDPRAQLKMLMI